MAYIGSNNILFSPEFVDNGKYSKIDASNLSEDNKADWANTIKLERTELVYDMASTELEYNWNKSGGILGGEEVTGKDFNKYNRLRIYCSWANVNNAVFELDLNKPIYTTQHGYDTPYVASYCSQATDALSDIYKTTVFVSNDKTSIKVVAMGYNGSGFSYTDRNNNSTYLVYKIEGVY